MILFFRGLIIPLKHGYENWSLVGYYLPFLVMSWIVLGGIDHTSSLFEEGRLYGPPLGILVIANLSGVPFIILVFPDFVEHVLPSLTPIKTFIEQGSDISILLVAGLIAILGYGTKRI
ncbi:MAG: hypothetical protein LBF15_06940 [Candidatus Peribacteria bacterium]|nr:hypothetical protein [Candidatus Peribacteria bacterium]